MGPEHRGGLPDGLEQRFGELLERRDGEDPVAEDKELYVRGRSSPRGLAWKILKALGEDPYALSDEAFLALDFKVIFAMKLAAADRAEYGGVGVGAVGAMRVELLEAGHGEEARFVRGDPGEPAFTLRLVCQLCEAHIPEPGDGHVMVLSDPPRRIYFTHHNYCYESLAREVLIERLGAANAPSRKELSGLRAPRYHDVKKTPWGYHVALRLFLEKSEFAERQWK